jgi:hypothetical protein
MGWTTGLYGAEPGPGADPAWSAAITARCARQDADAARQLADQDPADTAAEAAQLADANAVLLESQAFRAAEAKLAAAARRAAWCRG